MVAKGPASPASSAGRPADLCGRSSRYVGFSNTADLGFTMPFDLGPYGFEASQVLAGLNLRSGLVAQAPNGEFRFPQPVLSRVPLYFQWLVFDPRVQNGLAMSKAGKTVIYQGRRRERGAPRRWAAAAAPPALLAGLVPERGDDDYRWSSIASGAQGFREGGQGQVPQRHRDPVAARP